MDQNEKLDFIISELQQMRHTFSSNLASVEHKVDNMQTQITGMQNQITGMQNQITGMQGQISVLQEDVSDLKVQVSENTQFINALVNGQVRIEEKVDKLQNSYRFLEEATARNWNDIIELKKAT